jgi:hypothetical protein
MYFAMYVRSECSIEFASKALKPSKHRKSVFEPILQRTGLCTLNT